MFVVPGQNAESAEVSVGAPEDVDGQSGGARCAGKLLSRRVYRTIALANSAVTERLLVLRTDSSVIAQSCPR